MAFANTEENSPVLADAATTTTQIKRVTDVSSASRSEARTDLNESAANATQSSNEGGWGLSNSDSSLNTDLMNHNTANNPVVAAWMDGDQSVLPAGFNPNHAVGRSASNTYPWGQCTWYAYQRRTELGLPVVAASVTVVSGPPAPARWATGWTARLAMWATSWCSSPASKALIPTMGMSPWSRRSTPMVPSRYPNPM